MTINTLVATSGLTGIISTAWLIFAQGTGIPATHDVGPTILTFLSGTGTAGFVLWWLTSRVSTKQDEHTAELQRQTRALNRLTEHIATLVTLHELATAEMKHRAELAKAEIKSDEEPR